MKAISVYDDLAFLANAIARLQQLGRRPQVDVYWTTSALSMNALEHGATAKKSLIEAMNAHLIVIPARHAHAFPFSLHLWLERWAALREIQDATLFVMDDGTHADFPGMVSPELTRFTLKHGVKLIVDEDLAFGSAAKVAMYFPLEHEIPPPVEARRVESAVAFHSFRGFGINE